MKRFFIIATSIFFSTMLFWGCSREGGWKPDFPPIIDTIVPPSNPSFMDRDALHRRIREEKNQLYLNDSIRTQMHQRYLDSIPAY